MHFICCRFVKGGSAALSILIFTATALGAMTIIAKVCVWSYLCPPPPCLLPTPESRLALSLIWIACAHHAQAHHQANVNNVHHRTCPTTRANAHSHAQVAVGYRVQTWATHDCHSTGGQPPCVLPFDYKGIKFTSCTSFENDGRLW